MNESTKNKLRLVPRSVCSECRSRRSYTNPLGKCWECKKKYCFDHLYSLQVNAEMSENEEVRSVCESCRKAHGYWRLCDTVFAHTWQSRSVWKRGSGVNVGLLGENCAGGGMLIIHYQIYESTNNIKFGRSGLAICVWLYRYYGCVRIDILFILLSWWG